MFDLPEDVKRFVLNLPAAYWHEWVRELRDSGEELPNALRLVVIGGERASPAAFEDWCDLETGCVRLVNGYGPTEATVCTTVYELPRGARPPSASSRR